ncbi:MAG: di-trans,poly-cis-decaprenylcistransferase [Gammaproteobacteria bacterium HGW-Gammaproteobacteria-8]|nr:MAG: di-trans,poly-cis-decaprenylcistransferase [Gammaproteobacteria bacterium HGW-Gammaproteobacteria-8]
MSGGGTIPLHLAIVMDGNGRWAMRRGKHRTYGHQAGTEAARKIVRAVAERGIRHLTVYAFSSENWNRPGHEVRRLMSLFRRALDRETDRLHENGVRLNFIGHRGAFSRSIQAGMLRAEQLTCHNDRLILNIAASYGGRDDIVAASRALALRVSRGELDPEAIDQDSFAAATALAGQPDPDLFIRTGGERRLSNYLLWNLAYTELYFCDTLWPDFGEADLDKALADFAGRERRFGGLIEHAKLKHA